VLFDNGAGKLPTASSNPGDPYPAFEQSFSDFPVPGTTARTWYFGRFGTLNDNPSTASGRDAYTSNAAALPLNDYPQCCTGAGGLWGNASQWQWNWQQNPSGSAVSYTSQPLASDTTTIGGGAVQAWVKSSTPDVDLQATVSEIRPDGKETFVQNGWLRASERKLSTTSDNIFKQPSTQLEPIPTFLAPDAQPMPSGQATEVTIPLYFQGHVYRAGSRIKVTIAAPNGAQPIWSFNETQPPPPATASETIAFSKAMPSSLTLPVVPDVNAPPNSLPPCPSLRNEPCR
jgi:predicted acyl esterase